MKSAALCLPALAYRTYTLTGTVDSSFAFNSNISLNRFTLIIMQVVCFESSASCDIDKRILPVLVWLLLAFVVFLLVWPLLYLFACLFVFLLVCLPVFFLLDREEDTC